MDKNTLLVLDVDPGTDDACAMLIMSQLQKQPDYCVSTFGNMPLANTQRNMNIVAKATGLASILVKGDDRPDDGHEVTCGDFHGIDGLAGIADQMAKEYDVTDATIASNQSLDQLAQAILSADEVTYIVVGPMGSLSILLDKYPAVEQHIKHVLCMGGGIDVFNKDGNKEYNFAGDGPAVKRVFDSSLPLTIFPLDITHVAAKLTQAEIAGIDYSRRPWMKAILEQNLRSNMKYTPGIDYAVVHDVLPILYYKNPSNFEVEDMNLVADMGGAISRSPQGRTIHVALRMKPGYLYQSLKAAIEA